jgi:hypothetical protein
MRHNGKEFRAARGESPSTTVRFMVRGGLLIAAVAAVWMSPTGAWAQASFGPIQPFAGAPTPVYVAGPYAAPTALAPLGTPGIVAPPAVVAPPVVSPGFLGSTAPQVQLPAATLPPSLSVTPGAMVAPSLAQPSCGCGASQYARPVLGAPTTSYSPHMAPGYYGGYPATYGSQPLTGYGH